MPRLTPLERCGDGELVRRHRAGDRRSREVLIARHLPLARRLAMRYRASAHTLDDLVQVASLGLVKAVDRWEPERGLTFTTFAVPTVLGELRRYFRDSTWAVRPARDLQELALAVAAARPALAARLGREPTPGDLSEHVGRRADEIAVALQAAEARFAVSLDAVVAEDGDEASLGDLTAAPDPGFADVDANAALEHLLAVLDERAREVVRLRFAEELLQREIGERIGMSQMHVSRTLHASLERLEAYLRPRGHVPAFSPSPAGS